MDTIVIIRKWSKETVAKKDIEAALTRNADYELLVELVEHYADDPEDFMYDEWVAIHAIRLMSDLNDKRGILVADDIIDYFGEDNWDSIIVDNCESLLDKLACPENVEEYVKIFNGRFYESDEITQKSMLRRLIKCDYKTDLVLTELKKCFLSNPALFADNYVDLGDKKYIDSLASEIVKCAPYFKYIPFDRINVAEHNTWIEVGNAWYDLKNDIHVDTTFSFYMPDQKLRQDMTGVYYDNKKRDQALHQEFLSKYPDDMAAADLPIDVKQKIIYWKKIIEADKKRPSSTKLGRNDPCPCMSGKKYKKCCEKTDTIH